MLSFQLHKIQSGVDALLKDCNSTIMERNIMRKALGPKYQSGIVHTKGGSKDGKRETSQSGKGKVYAGRGNQSPIGQAVPVDAGIFKAKPQAHPGKATMDKSKLIFCELCGCYITRKCTLCDIFSTHSHTFSNKDGATSNKNPKAPGWRNTQHSTC